MGFFDKIKSVGRMITGGGATVHLEVGEATLGEPIPVRVKALIADSDLKIDAVYIRIRGEEIVKVDEKDLVSSIRSKIQDFAADGRLDDVIFREETYSTRVNISGPEVLNMEDTIEWEGEIELPAGALPSYTGRRCEHRWQIFAGLDAPGNDPDSGWIDLQIKA